MDSAVFIRRLRQYSNAVPDAAQQPLILVYDGCSSHYNGEIVSEAVRLKIILVSLPANAPTSYNRYTWLFQAFQFQY